MLGSGLNVAARTVHDHYPQLGGGRNIDVVNTHAGPGHDLEFLCGIEEGFGDLCL